MRANALDRLIGYVDPGRALRRVVDRERLQRAYEAASPRDTWRPRRGGASASADHFADAATLRIKARALVQNVPYVAASMDALVSNVIGTGIVPRFTGPFADKLNALWAQWAEVCDADGRLDFYGMQAAAYRAMEQDGEVLVRLRPRRMEDGYPVPLQLQLLEIDWLDSTRNSGVGGSYAGVAPGNIVVEGIEYDSIGRVAAYWLWDQHPGDISVLRGMRNFSKRVPASSIVHLFDPKRPGQGRGISRLAPIIARTRDTQLYEDAEIARKNLESRLSVLVSGDASQMANELQLNAGGSGAADASTARRTGDLGELASGAITELPAGSTITTVEPKAAGGHVEYVTYQVHIITAALGVTYEMATGDMTQVNFSSARVRLQDVRRGFEHTQWMVLVPRWCRPLAQAFALAAMSGGKLREGAAYGVEYDPPKYDYVNPAQEAQADALQVATGLASLSSKLRARGENPAKVFDEIAADFQKLKDLGVLDTLFFLQKGTLRITDPNADPAELQGRALEGIGNVLARMDTRLSGLEQRSTEVTVQTGGTTVTMPERSVTVEGAHLEVHPPQVRNEIHVEPTPVTVEGARVEVHPPEVRNEVHVDPSITVQPAQVQLHMPVRQTETSIKTDANGRVIGSTSVETNKEK